MFCSNNNQNVIGNPRKIWKVTEGGMCSPAKSLGFPCPYSPTSQPFLAPRFHIPPSYQGHSSWDHLLTFFYYFESNWSSKRSHECHCQLEGETVMKEQDLSISATANLRESTESTTLHLQVHKRPWLQFSGLYPILLYTWVRPKCRSCLFSSSGSETAYTSCLFDPR